jgi:AraC-like DNA-binding protein
MQHGSSEASVVDHLRRDLGCMIGELARLAGMCAAHLFDRFRVCIELTPRSYANVIKLEFALDRIAHADTSFAELSELLGFANQSHFMRFFRCRVGVNPRTYRASILIAQSRSGEIRYVA